MFTVSLVGQKGGTGKTTLAVNLGVAASLAGRTAVILDLDPQANAVHWKERRAADQPVVIPAQVGRLRQTLSAAKEHRADWVFVDTPGKSDSVAIEAARVADVTLIPVRPQIFDVETLPALRDLLYMAGQQAAFVVLNGVHPRASRTVKEARELIERTFAFDVLAFHLCHRKAYAEAPAAGLGVHEWGDEKATVEVQRLFQWLLERRR